jgi:tripartite ATP-independent transporter DctP family solute receptor
MKKSRVLIAAGLALAAFFGWQYLAPRPPQGETFHLLLAHNLAPDHPVHLGMEHFARLTRERSQGRISVTLYPSGQLGTEKEVLELVQLGAVTMTKVSSLSLESFSPLVGILNLPFLFRDRAHDFRVLDSAIGEELLAAPTNVRLRGLTFFDAGDRSFYAGKPVLRPADVVGLKIRVMESATAIRMMQLLGGSPTPMPYGEVYTALQQGVIDGAENNVTALTVNRHGEVAKHYSRVQHIFAPDILVISEPVWKKMSVADQAILRTAADEAKAFQRDLWSRKLGEYERIAKEEMGVKFYDPDKAPFQQLVQPLHQEFAARGPQWARLIQAIKSL